MKLAEHLQENEKKVVEMDKQEVNARARAVQGPSESSQESVRPSCCARIPSKLRFVENDIHGSYLK